MVKKSSSGFMMGSISLISVLRLDSQKELRCYSCNIRGFLYVDRHRGYKMQADETLNDQNPTNSCHPSRLGKRTARDVTRRVPAAMIINSFLVCLGPPDPMFFFWPWHLRIHSFLTFSIFHWNITVLSNWSFD